MKKILALLLLLCLGAGAQEAPAVSSEPFPAATEPPAASERETPLQAMIRTFEQVRKEREENAARLVAIQAQMQELQRQPTANAYAAQAVAIGRAMQELQSCIHVERENQIDFKNEIDRYSANRQLLRQEASYISHYLDELRKYGLEQDKTASMLLGIQRAIAVGLEKLPPPPEFSNRLGISFVLVAPKGQQPFYITARILDNEQYLAVIQQLTEDAEKGGCQREAERVSREGVTYAEAQRLALGIGHLSGTRVTLPTAKEAAALASVGYGKHLEKAVWLADRWNDSYEEREAMVRFGVVMGAVWDPAECLRKQPAAAGNAISAELPEAHYPELGCIFVAPLAAGKAARLAQAEANAENEVPEGGEEQ